MKSLTSLKTTLLLFYTVSEPSVSGWTLSYSRILSRRRQRHGSSYLLMQDFLSDDRKSAPPPESSDSYNSYPFNERYPGGEVVGSTGKIGSFLLHRLSQQSSCTSDATKYPQSLNVAPTPRGVAPGCLSPPNTPIYACIPSSSIQDVWESTVPHRRDDLVFICNCVPSRHLNFDVEYSDFSVVVPHFGIPHIRPSGERFSLTPIVHTSPESPPTIIYGKHADTLATLLQREDIPVQIVQSPQEIQIAAVRKLAWASVMWLICHDNGENAPLTVKEVHEGKASDLERVVEVILPCLEMLSLESWTDRGEREKNESQNEKESIGTVESILKYLLAYSMSIDDGNVIPSKDLAMVEIQERNFLFIALKMMITSTKENLQTDFHVDMIRRVIGEKKFRECLEDMNATKNINRKANRSKTTRRVRCVSSNLEFLVHPTEADKNSYSERGKNDVDKSVVIIGAGIVGSSIAYHLSQQPGIKVTVVDQRLNILPNTPDNTIDVGIATASTFAWLNANDKSPLSYMQLNKIGMESWRRHVLLKDLPVWCGSIVRKKRLQGDELDPEKLFFTEKYKSHYSRIGPLTAEAASRLEPAVTFKSTTTQATNRAASNENQNDEFYFYPEEGHVNPSSAVKALRQAANANGAKFVGGVQIHELLRDTINGKINGIKVKLQGSDKPELISSDMVVISAGANSSDPILGIGTDRLPLLYQPGSLTYVQSPSTGIDVDNKLKRIVVDTISQFHILRRRDGTLVIGGGQLVVGGSEDLSLEKESYGSLKLNETGWDDKLVGEAMIENVVRNIAPLELIRVEANVYRDSVRISRANRPMPSDGLPVVGTIESGLFVVVSHSAMTLGLVLGELSALEISRIISGHDEPNHEKLYGFKILDSYRPHRFWRSDSR
ncbi:hypothetical protein ACHAXS_005441 [Conticribra weissflogii]